MPVAELITAAIAAALLIPMAFVGPLAAAGRRSDPLLVAPPGAPYGGRPLAASGAVPQPASLDVLDSQVGSAYAALATRRRTSACEPVIASGTTRLARRPVDRREGGSRRRRARS